MNLSARYPVAIPPSENIAYRYDGRTNTWDVLTSQGFISEGQADFTRTFRIDVEPLYQALVRGVEPSLAQRENMTAVNEALGKALAQIPTPSVSSVIPIRTSFSEASLVSAQIKENPEVLRGRVNAIVESHNEKVRLSLGEKAHALVQTFHDAIETRVPAPVGPYVAKHFFSKSFQHAAPTSGMAA